MSYVESVLIRDPITGDIATVTPALALKVDGSAVTQPVSMATAPTGAATEATLANIEKNTNSAVHILEQPPSFDQQTGATKIVDVNAASTKNVGVLTKGVMTVDVSFEPYIQNQIGYYAYRLTLV